MPRPVQVQTAVPQPREEVWAYLDVLANHEAFTDLLLTDWRPSGPAAGVGAKAQVTATALGVTDTVDIEVVAAEPPRRSVERNHARKAGRTATGTYELDALPDGGTQITFTYRWERAPLADRLAAPLVRALIRRANRTAMARLAQQLAATPTGPRSRA